VKIIEYKAEIREIPEHIIYFKRFFIEDMDLFYKSLSKRNFLQELSDKVMAENRNIELTDPDYNVLLFVDGEYKERDVTVEFCDAVTALGKKTNEYGFRVVPAFTALNVLHKGPNKRLSEAYRFAYQWMQDNGYVKVGCPRNSAIDGFWNKDSEEDYLTEIQIPVEKRSRNYR
jgi:effector-binding domain-containing protein